jgi:hypothetical protein
MAEFGVGGERSDDAPRIVPLVRDWNVLTQYYEDNSSAETSDAVRVGEALSRACLRRPVARLDSAAFCPEEHLATRSEIFQRLSRRAAAPRTLVGAAPGKVEEVSCEGAERWE